MFLNEVPEDEQRSTTVVDTDLYDGLVSSFTGIIGQMGIDKQIDEVALLFTDRQAKTDWMDRAIEDPRVHIFNAAWDLVKTWPIASTYRARYDFIEIQNRDYRLECMRVAGGLSPLHQPLIDANLAVAGPVPVHVSFKAGSSIRDLHEAEAALRESGWERAQSCRSDYGAFSYWTHAIQHGPDWRMPKVYLKPRVNLRDE